MLEVDCSSANVTITLYTITGNIGQELNIRRVNGGGNTVIISAQSGETINGSSTRTINARYDAPHLYVGRTEWGLL